MPSIPKPKPASHLTLTKALHLIGDAALPPREKLTLLMLLRFAKHTTYAGARPSVRKLGVCIGRGATQAREALRALEDLGLISPVGRRSGGRKATTWQLHLERLGDQAENPSADRRVNPTARRRVNPPVFRRVEPTGPPVPIKRSSTETAKLRDFDSGAERDHRANESEVPSVADNTAGASVRPPGAAPAVTVGWKPPTMPATFGLTPRRSATPPFKALFCRPSKVVPARARAREVEARRLR